MPPFGFEQREQAALIEKAKSFHGYKKQFVGVQCLFTEDGKMLPQIIYFDSYNIYEVDKVIDIRNAPSLKAGGVGMRYTVRILGKETYIFYDKYENKWFVEAKN